MAKGTSNQFKFSSSPAANWLYITWSTKMLSNGDTEVTATLRMRHTMRLDGTWSFYMTMLGVRKEFRVKVNQMVVGTIKDWVVGTMVGTKKSSQYSKSDPYSIPISCEATINGYHIINKGNILLGKASGTVNAKSDLWEVPTVKSATVTSTSDSITPKVVLDGNPYDMFRIKLSVQAKGSSTVNEVTSNWGVSDYSNQFIQLSPFTTYEVFYTLMEYNDLTTTPKKILIKEITTQDEKPIVSKLEATSVTKNSIQVRTAVDSRSPVTYQYKLGTGSWIDSGVTHSFTGLNQNTLYKVSVRVKNSQGSWITSTVDVTTKFDPPVITNVQLAPSTESVVATITATSSVGISSYEMVINNVKTTSNTNKVTRDGLQQGTGYTGVVRVIDNEGVSSISNISFTTKYGLPVITSVASDIMNPKSASISVAFTAPAGLKSLIVKSKTAPLETYTSQSRSVIVTDGTPGTTRSYDVQIEDASGQLSVVRTLDIKYPTKDSGSELLGTGVPVKFVRNTTENLKLVPIKDGQVLLDISTGDTYFDIGTSRRVLGSSVIKLSLVSGALETSEVSGLGGPLVGEGMRYAFSVTGSVTGATDAVVKFKSDNLSYALFDTDGVAVKLADVPQVFSAVVISGKLVM